MCTWLWGRYLNLDERPKKKKAVQLMWASTKQNLFLYHNNPSRLQIAVFFSLSLVVCENRLYLFIYPSSFFFSTPFLQLCFNFCFTKANLSYGVYVSSFKGHKVYSCKGHFLVRLFVLLTHFLATSDDCWKSGFICVIISELYRGNIMSQLNSGYYDSFTRARCIKKFIKMCLCVLTINTWSHCLWEDNNKLMALQYNFTISDFIWQLIF